MSTPGTAPATVQTYPLSTHVFIEGLGSFFIVFVGLATALFSASTSAVAFGYGLAMVAALISFGHISTGYFNPVFALAMAVAGRIKWLSMVLYMLAQVIGAGLAAGVIFALVQVLPAGATGGSAKVFGTLSSGFDSHSPLKVPMVGVMIVEIVAAALVVAVILGATSMANKTNLAPFGVGLALGVAVTVTVPVGNTALNPAASTSVALLTDSWAPGQLWLFWLAPLFGAALAAAIYRTFLSPALAGVEKMDDDASVPVAADSPDARFAGDEEADVALPETVAVTDGTADAAVANANANADASTVSVAAAPAAGAPAAAGPVAEQPVRSDAQDFFDKSSK